jgi:hypothetical protein
MKTLNGSGILVPGALLSLQDGVLETVLLCIQWVGSVTSAGGAVPSFQSSILVLLATTRSFELGPVHPPRH